MARSKWAMVILAAGVLVAAIPAFAGVTERVSVSSSGEEGDCHSGGGFGGGCSGSYSPAISADGRFVAFSSDANSFVPGDTNTKDDVFVRDRLIDTTERISISSTGEEGIGDSGEYGPAISADGRFVVFRSGAPNLVPGDTNGCYDVFVHDRLAETTEIISVSTWGEQGNNHSRGRPDITADGHFVAFASDAANLVPGDTNGRPDIFVRDRLARTTQRVSVSSAGEQGNGDYGSPAMSADGRFVAFAGSGSSNIVPGDTNGFSDIFVHDRLAGTTERVSISTGGEQGNGDCNSPTVHGSAPAISGDGRFVLFASGASNLVVDDTNQSWDVFVRDRLTQTTERVSVSAAGEQGNFWSKYPAISADGRFVAFSSYASNLVREDANGTCDVFVRDRVTGTTGLASLSSWGEQGNGCSLSPAISAHGRFLAFASDASDLVSGDTNETRDAFVRHREGFVDVPFSHWAFDEVSACCSASVVSGYPDGTYQPGAPVSRDQMAVFISRSICTPTGEAGLVDYTPPATPTFPDVVDTIYWAYKYIEYAAEHNIVGGYPDGLYHPNEPVNRGQMAVFIARALVAPAGDSGIPMASLEPTFPDVVPESEWQWCYDHIQYIAAQDVTQGYEDGLYHPEYVCTRDQMAVYLARAFDLNL